MCSDLYFTIKDSACIIRMLALQWVARVTPASGRQIKEIWSPEFLRLGLPASSFSVGYTWDFVLASWVPAAKEAPRPDGPLPSTEAVAVQVGGASLTARPAQPMQVSLMMPQALQPGSLSNSGSWDTLVTPLQATVGEHSSTVDSESPLCSHPDQPAPQGGEQKGICALSDFTPRDTLPWSAQGLATGTWRRSFRVPAFGYLSLLRLTGYVFAFQGGVSKSCYRCGWNKGVIQVSVQSPKVTTCKQHPFGY